MSSDHGDPYGFLDWLNAQRAMRGLGVVDYDQDLTNDAATNNGQQRARGIGHHFMGRARRQNSGMGEAEAVWPMWVASPSHASALFDPSITRIGIAEEGGYWTFSAC